MGASPPTTTERLTPRERGSVRREEEARRVQGTVQGERRILKRTSGTPDQTMSERARAPSVSEVSAFFSGTLRKEPAGSKSPPSLHASTAEMSPRSLRAGSTSPRELQTSPAAGPEKKALHSFCSAFSKLNGALKKQSQEPGLPRRGHGEEGCPRAEREPLRGAPGRGPAELAVPA